MMGEGRREEDRVYSISMGEMEKMEVICGLGRASTFICIKENEVNE